MTRIRGVNLIVAAGLGLTVLASTLGATDRTDRTSGSKGTAAAGAVRPVVSGARTVGVVSGVRSSTVVGTAWEADNTPIKGAKVRLRDVVTGKIESVGTGNDAGQFQFDAIDPGSYVVELLSDAGKVRAVGHMFTIGPGETVATFVRLETKGPWAAAFFRNTASVVAIAAASQGITALSPAPLCRAGAASPPCD